MNLIEIFSIIIIHWFADFIMQDEKWALGKSKNWNDLLKHTFTYSFIWFFILIVIGLIGWVPNPNFYNFYTPSFIILFVITTFICHTITDYFTSRIVSKKFEKQEYGSSIPNIGAFSWIGFDQILHYLQLFITYWLLTK